jgi:DNA-binding MarR family transcriptional regulator
MAAPKIEKDGAQQKKLRANEKKWTPELMKPGWTMVPSVLMEYQRELGLNPIQFNILMQLAKHWWKEAPPFVSKSTIARALRVSPRTVQRHLTALEQAGLIRREVRFRQDGGRTSNRYVFDGLIEKARPYAAQMAEAREKKLAERASRMTPQLRLVKREGASS